MFRCPAAALLTLLLLLSSSACSSDATDESASATTTAQDDVDDNADSDVSSPTEDAEDPPALATPTAAATAEPTSESGLTTESATAETDGTESEAAADAPAADSGSAAASSLEPTGQAMCDAAFAADLSAAGPRNDLESSRISDDRCSIDLADGEILAFRAFTPDLAGGATGQALLDEVVAGNPDNAGGAAPVDGVGLAAVNLTTEFNNHLYVLVNDEFVLDLNSGEISLDALTTIATNVLAAAG